jgi:hypothetical protein
MVVSAALVGLTLTLGTASGANCGYCFYGCIISFPGELELRQACFMGCQYACLPS